MKLITAAAIIALAATTAWAGSTQVKGYYRKDGTYVAPHVRSTPDGRSSNNYGPASSSPNYLPKSTYGNPLAAPYTRDSDKDGMPNNMDLDDDNDGIYDDMQRR